MTRYIAGVASKARSAALRSATPCVFPSAPPIAPARGKARRRSPATFSTSSWRPAGGGGQSTFAIALCCCLPSALAGAGGAKSRGCASRISRNASLFQSMRQRRRSRRFPSWPCAFVAPRLHPPRRGRVRSSSGGRSKLCTPGSNFRRSTAARCFGASINGERSAPRRSIHRASTPSSKHGAPLPCVRHQRGTPLMRARSATCPADRRRDPMPNNICRHAAAPRAAQWPTIAPPYTRWRSSSRKSCVWIALDPETGEIVPA